jgi:hypothetical protein
MNEYNGRPRVIPVLQNLQELSYCTDGPDNGLRTLRKCPAESHCVTVHNMQIAVRNQYLEKYKTICTPQLVLLGGRRSCKTVRDSFIHIVADIFRPDKISNVDGGFVVFL